ncbi:MAG: AAA family ATPase [Patescibacteria group bacterium]|jgi:dephospho-CoA kinase
MPNGANKIILGFVGPIASGKGTVCRYLETKHGASVFRFSTMLRDILNRLYLEQNRTNMQNVSLALRQTFGDDLLASVVAKDVTNSPAKIIAIDGVRREPDIKYLRELPGFHLIEIAADQKIRWQRIIKRGENADDAKKTLAELRQDELKEAEQQIKEVAKLAEFILDNNGTLDELHRQIEEILQKAGK